MTDMTQPSIQQHYGRLISLTLPCPDVSLAHFLMLAKGQPRFYWESSRDSVAFAGFGTAVEIMEWGTDRFTKVQDKARDLFTDAIIDDANQPLTAPRLFGGFAFRDDFVPDNTWADFTPAHFVLPHYQLVSIDGEKWLTLNTQLPHDENPDEIIPELRQALQDRITWLQAQPIIEDTDAQTPTNVAYPMPYDDWAHIITSSTTRMKNKEFKKVVLSRVAEVTFNERINVDNALRYLADTYAESYRFLFEPRPYHAFYGASPELLVSVDGATIQTMGLAGSIGRGKTAEEDEHFAQTLLNSPKDSYEHQLVIDQIEQRLSPITSDLMIGETGILALSNIQHIHTPVHGTLKNPQGILPILAQLHPTPALGGTPRDIAMQIIRESETVPRGWYAAPVGWIDRNLDGNFTVAIRSAIAQEKRVWMYAGAGIVADSEPEKEWNETALKFRPMLNALGINEDILV